mgnify:CR=1 FL=1
MKICLDAGHYGYYNQSPANKSYYESKMVWKLHLMLKRYLESYGVEVITTRSEQGADLALFDRGAKAAGCDLFFSLHSNAVGNGVNNKIDYVVAYAAINGSADPIAEKLVNRIAEVMGTSQAPRIEHRRGNNGDYYGVVRGATAVGVPGAILEHSFHTNRRITDWLLQDANLDKLARAEAEVIAEHYGLTGGSETVPPAEQKEHWYRIRKTWKDVGSQIGAYKNLKNAKKACPSGYSVFDWNGKAVYSRGNTTEYPYVGKCTGNSVNVRKGPGIRYGNIKNWPKLNKGNLVDVLGKEGAWYKIRIAGKYEGYISEKYLKRA